MDDVCFRTIPSDLEARLFRKLHMIDGSVTDQDLRVSSNHFEKLRDNLAEFDSIRVKQPWDGARGEADRIYLDDRSSR